MSANRNPEPQALEACRTCRFWRPVGYSQSGYPGSKEIGHCCAGRPLYHHRDGRAWPVTREDDGCGEHEAKPSKEQRQ